MNIKIFLSTFALTLFFFIQCTKKDMNVTEEQKEQMRNTATEFMGKLKSTLISQINTKGVVSAFDVCSDTAQLLTNEFGLQKGVFIKRVSAKNRNKNNFPDEYEQKALNNFQEMLNSQKLDRNSEKADLVKEGEFTYLRYMKPIVIQKECLSCHGNKDTMIEEVRNLIAVRYPEDKAVDYNTGELRGAVSIKKLVE